MSMQMIRVYGLLKDPEYFIAKLTAEGLSQKHADEFDKPMCIGMIENDWLNLLRGLKQENLTNFSSGSTLIFVDDELVGNSQTFINWAAKNYTYTDSRPLPLFHALAKEEYKTYLLGKNLDYVYFDVKVGDEKIGRLLFQLYSQSLPKTCGNFKQLCIGDKTEGKVHDPPIALSYQGSIFHRVVKNGWVQGGDFIKGSGSNGWSIYGECFPDESYSLNHSKRGMLGMANKGRHTNASQFYITLQPAKWMDNQYVVFGEVIEGFDVLKRLEDVKTFNERPLVDCLIDSCGVLDIQSLYS